MRLLVAAAQLLAFGALVAAGGPLFTGTAVPLGRSVGVAAIAIALAFALGRHRDGATVGRGNQVRLVAALAFWAALALVLTRARVVGGGQAAYWAAAGVVVFIQALGTALADGEDQARGLAVRAGIAGAVAAFVGALTGHGALPGAAALGLVGMGTALVAHAVARSLLSGVDTARVGRSAAASVAVVGAVAVLLSVGPVSRAAAAALEAVLGGIGLVLALAAAPLAYLLYALLQLLHPHSHATHLPPHPPSRNPKTPPVAAATHPLFVHGAEVVLAAGAVALLLVLVGRARRSAPPHEGEGFHDEILPPDPLRRPRLARRPTAPPAGLRRTYAEALGVLARADDASARPAPADTPAAIESRLGRVLTSDSKALDLFRRLSGAYALLRYGDGPSALPMPPAELMAALRAEVRPARRTRRSRGPGS